MVACQVDDSLRVTSYRSDMVTTIESNMFHNVAATGACEQETFDGVRLLYTLRTILRQSQLLRRSR